MNHSHALSSEFCAIRFEQRKNVSKVITGRVQARFYDFHHEDPITEDIMHGAHGIECMP